MKNKDYAKVSIKSEDPLVQPLNEEFNSFSLKCEDTPPVDEKLPGMKMKTEPLAIDIPEEIVSQTESSGQYKLDSSGEIPLGGDFRPASQSLIASREESWSEASKFIDQPIDIFFKELFTAVKSKSPEFQHTVKRKVFDIVADLAWSNLQNKKRYIVPQDNPDADPKC